MSEAFRKIHKNLLHVSDQTRPLSWHGQVNVDITNDDHETTGSNIDIPFTTEANNSVSEVTLSIPEIFNNDDTKIFRRRTSSIRSFIEENDPLDIIEEENYQEPINSSNEKESTTRFNAGASDIRLKDVLRVVTHSNDKAENPAELQPGFHHTSSEATDCNVCDTKSETLNHLQNNLTCQNVVQQVPASQGSGHTSICTDDQLDGRKIYPNKNMNRLKMNNVIAKVLSRSKTENNLKSYLPSFKDGGLLSKQSVGLSTEDTGVQQEPETLQNNKDGKKVECSQENDNNERHVKINYQSCKGDNTDGDNNDNETIVAVEDESQYLEDASSRSSTYIPGSNDAAETGLDVTEFLNTSSKQTAEVTNTPDTFESLTYKLGSEQRPPESCINTLTEASPKVNAWLNHSEKFCKLHLGLEKYEERLQKCLKHHKPGLGSKTRLSFAKSRLRDMVKKQTIGLFLGNSIGAFGYARVVDSFALPTNPFFTSGRILRVRMRFSAVDCDDDAASCIRQATIKMADCNEDGPLDLMFHTGRFSLHRNCKTFMDHSNISGSIGVQNACLRDPFFYKGLVDGLRRCPESYANLHYYSQIVYSLESGRENALVRFRLIPHDDVPESGLLQQELQRNPWDTERAMDDNKPRDHLKQELEHRLLAGIVKFRLQVQTKELTGVSCWNPQQEWEEDTCPWRDIMELTLTTLLPPTTLQRTYFNVINRPSCLGFGRSPSIWDYRSYADMLVTLYTTQELSRIEQNLGLGGETAVQEKDQVTHVVTLSSRRMQKNTSRVHIFVTLIGSQGRSISHHLEKKVTEESLQSGLDETISYIITSLPVGEVVALSIGIRHRHIADSLFLKSVILSELGGSKRLHFPCQSIVNSKVFLRPGDARLPNQEMFEVGKQERLLALWNSQEEYVWNEQESLPSIMKSNKVKDLPLNEQVLLAKYKKLPWDLHSTIGDGFGHIGSRQSTNHQTASATYSMMMLTGSSRATMMHALNAKRLKNQSATSNRMVGTLRNTPRPVSASAKKRWSKLKNCLHFLAHVTTVIPEGPKGAMCRLVDDDVDFGRLYLQGKNPTIIRKCDALPPDFRVTEDQIRPYMGRGLPLHKEMENGNVFIADYNLLSDIPCLQKDANARYQAAPLCLLYLRTTGVLVPIGIQLDRNNDDIPVWTPAATREDWLMAKLWVRHADFQYQLGLHLLHCHLVLEPFIVALFRQLSSCHPVYKLLHHYSQYIIAGNTVMRHHLMDKGGNLDKWTSMGSQGFQIFLQRLYKEFTFDDLDLNLELKKRGVYSSCKLREYLYRDDAIRVWDAINHYMKDTIAFYYADDRHVQRDQELQRWMDDVINNGFKGRTAEELHLSERFNTKEDLSSLLTSLVFTMTCKHSATSSEAMDMFGFEPMVPASMRQPPPSQPGLTKRGDIIATLPDQDPDIYAHAVAVIKSMKKQDKQSLLNTEGPIFIETPAKKIFSRFQQQLQFSNKMILKRNAKSDYPYDAILPANIPSSLEPLPISHEDHSQDGMEECSSTLSRTDSPKQSPVQMLSLPLCVQLMHGGKDMLTRHISTNILRKAMSTSQLL